MYRVTRLEEDPRPEAAPGMVPYVVIFPSGEARLAPWIAGPYTACELVHRVLNEEKGLDPESKSGLRGPEKLYVYPTDSIDEARLMHIADKSEEMNRGNTP